MSVSVCTTRSAPGFQWLTPDEAADHEAVFSIGERSAADSPWRPLPMHLVVDDDDGTPLLPADLPWAGATTLGLAPRAIDAIGRELSPFGELLPLSGTASDCVLFDCRTVLDVLDEDASELFRVSSGRIMGIRRPVFTRATFDDVAAFRLPQTPRGPVYFADWLVEKIVRQSLEGTHFTTCWTCP